jgi:hypothetical protein
MLVVYITTSLDIVFSFPLQKQVVLILTLAATTWVTLDDSSVEHTAPKLSACLQMSALCTGWPRGITLLKTILTPLSTFFFMSLMISYILNGVQKKRHEVC